MEVLQHQYSKMDIIDTCTHTHTHTHTLTPDSTDLVATGGPKVSWGRQDVQ